jgi:hypothetical protein
MCVAFLTSKYIWQLLTEVECVNSFPLFHTISIFISIGLDSRYSPSLVLMTLASNNGREEKNTHILIMKVSVGLSCVDWGHKIKMIHFTDRLVSLVWLKKQ